MHSVGRRIRHAVNDEMKIADGMFRARRRHARGVSVLRAQRGCQTARDFFGGLACARRRRVQNRHGHTVNDVIRESSSRIKRDALAFRQNRNVSLVIGDVRVANHKDLCGNDDAPEWIVFFSTKGTKEHPDELFFSFVFLRVLCGKISDLSRNLERV